MFADVIPLLRMPRSTSTFTYNIPSSLEGMLVIGQCVLVPWRGRSIPAIIASFAETTNFKRIADIEAVVETTPSWDKARVESLLQHGREQFAAVSTLAQAFFPDVPKRQSKKAEETAATATEAAEVVKPVTYTLPKRDLQALKTALESVGDQSLHIHSQGERFFLIKSWAQRATGQVLVLVPTLFDAQELSAFLAAALHEPVGLFGGVENKTKRWQRWTDIRDGKYRIVVATRSGALLPLKNLSTIIVDQDDDQDHRSWEAAPYYDSRVLAQTLCKNLSIPFRRISFFPRLDHSGASAWQELSTTWPQQELFLHNRALPLLQETLSEQLEETLAAGKHVLIICTQRAAASAFACLDCQYRWLCHACHTPLLHSEQSLACARCDYTQPIPDACSRCGGQRLRGFAPGAEALAKQLPLDLKAPAVLFRATDDAAIIRRLAKPTLILSTPFTWRRFAGTTKIPIGAVLFFQPERMLFTPDYRANEWYLRTLAWHRALVYGALRLPLLVQSSLQEQNPMLPLGASLSWPTWQAEEKKNRQAVFAPPYGQTVLVTLKDEQTAFEAEIGARLRADFSPFVFGPTKERHRISWFIKIPNQQSQNLDKLNDSVYSKALLYSDPESSI